MPQKIASQKFHYHVVSRETSCQFHREISGIQCQRRMEPTRLLPLRQVWTSPQTDRCQAKNQPDLVPHP